MEKIMIEEQTIQVNISKTALWSMILGILSFAIMYFGLLTAIPAIICGHIAKSKIKESNGKLLGTGMANAGIILGYINIIASIIIIVLFFLFVLPNLSPNCPKWKSGDSVFEEAREKPTKQTTQTKQTKLTKQTNLNPLGLLCQFSL